ncbi:HNH endonuclease signature motif containing protein [Lentzea sp. BCCO 10_0798]|uniref:HNH endonuclease signature motif containing protein n=1 Tax=Lentzea kristufekii TaxID=3095430 RepID=A0ABU4TJV4_9PSEU|nr:HNH endonuclease signature motif containing protein [Lentzea sp. BCCO 10_0798]MDX8048518.1 HNH endonuclease signature motif containing protein [Lentzea sp. BCCO 10_0798]
MAQGKRSFLGNEGYADVEDSYYVYDDGVAYHKQVTAGDLVVVRTKVEALGVATIEQIEVNPDATKLRRRCPHCKKTRFGRNGDGTTAYRCGSKDCGRTFDEPLERDEPVIGFEAHYEGTWRAIRGAITAAQLEGITTSEARQNAIRPLDTEGVKRLLAEAHVPSPPTPAKDKVRKPIAGGIAKSLVTVRKGQKEFRKSLLERYGLVCMVTGPNPEQALHAAHLRAFAKHQRHVPEEGALLRADIHQLFDLGMIAVDPATLTVVVDPRLRAYPSYRDLGGQALQVPADKVPCMEALRDHHQHATSRWATT